MSEPLQRTEAWRMARAGRVTASRVSDVITTTRTGWGHARAKYANQLVAERLTGRPQDMRRIPSLDDRADLEPEAITAYTFYTGNEVELVGFIQHPTIEMAGASPDGLVGKKGGIEIKCLNAENHIKLIEGDDSPMIEYMPQMMFGMASAARPWWDFVAYCPIMPEHLKLFTRRIDLDKEVIERMEGLVNDFLVEVDARVARILAR